jgi:hypothetical protein
MHRKVGLLALVLALTLLASGAAHAMPLAGSARPSESQGIMERFWGWIESFFRSHSSSAGQLKSIWAQDSSHIDPNGGED